MGLPLFAYAIHTGHLYGMERMVLATLDGLRHRFRPVLVTPPGPALARARSMGISAVEYSGPVGYARALYRLFALEAPIVVADTTVAQAAIGAMVHAVHPRATCGRVHVVHGCEDDHRAYGHKHLLRGIDTTVVAVSEFVRQRLVFHGLPASRIVTIPNFLCRSAQRHALAPRPVGLRRVVAVGRLSRGKRVDVLLDAIASRPELGAIEVRILGDGDERDALAARARGLNVTFAGFADGVDRELAQADLLVHTCPNEPFGLVLLEAWAAGIPALVPDSGGAAWVVRDGIDGWHFRANDPASLAARLSWLHAAPAEVRERAAASGRAALETRFGRRVVLDAYADQLHRALAPVAQVA
jgi:glycosyltransferase involved in cell wall biosynthesis